MICLFSFETKIASSSSLALFISTLVAEGWHALQSDGMELWRKSFAEHLSSACIEHLVRQTVDLAAWVAEMRVVEYTLQIGQGLALRNRLCTADNGARALRVPTLH